MSHAALRKPDAGSRDLQRLYEQHKGQVYRWALQFGAGDKSWAEDVTHDVFLRVFQSFSALSAPEDLGGYFYRVTANVAMGRLRRERRLMTRFQLWLRQDEVDPGPHELVQLAQESKRALEQLKALPPDERAVLTMKLLDGKKQREIAEALSLSEGYVSKLVSRGLQRIRKAGWEVSDDAP